MRVTNSLATKRVGTSPANPFRLKVVLGDFAFFSGDIITLADGLSDENTHEAPETCMPRRDVTEPMCTKDRRYGKNMSDGM